MYIWVVVTFSSVLSDSSQQGVENTDDLIPYMVKEQAPDGVLDAGIGGDGGKPCWTLQSRPTMTLQLINTEERIHTMYIEKNTQNYSCSNQLTIKIKI